MQRKEVKLSDGRTLVLNVSDDATEADIRNKVQEFLKYDSAFLSPRGQERGRQSVGRPDDGLGHPNKKRRRLVDGPASSPGQPDLTDYGSFFLLVVWV